MRAKMANFVENRIKIASKTRSGRVAAAIPVVKSLDEPLTNSPGLTALAGTETSADLRPDPMAEETSESVTFVST